MIATLIRNPARLARVIVVRSRVSAAGEVGGWKGRKTSWSGRMSLAGSASPHAAAGAIASPSTTKTAATSPRPGELGLIAPRLARREPVAAVRRDGAGHLQHPL